MRRRAQNRRSRGDRMATDSDAAPRECVRGRALLTHQLERVAAGLFWCSRCGALVTEGPASEGAELSIRYPSKGDGNG